MISVGIYDLSQPNGSPSTADMLVVGCARPRSNSRAIQRMMQPLTVGSQEATNDSYE